MDCKCDNKCDRENCKCDENNSELFDKISRIFETNDFKGEIVLVSFGLDFDKHVIGKIFNVYDKVIVLYDIFQIVPDKSNEKSSLIGYARGTVGDVVSIPQPFTCGLPDIDVVENYLNVLKNRKKMFKDYKEGKDFPKQNVVTNTTLQ